MSVTPNRVLFGAAYYQEYHQPGEEPSAEVLKRDMDLMVDAGFTVIRVGESVWSTWEPEEGRFDLDWLQPVLDGAHERGISVVLGTPTYAVPMWLARRYPEVAGERATGRPMGWGARQEVDFTHPAFRFHADRVLRRIVTRYVDHPAVIGYQVDNEPGLHLLHNHGVFQRFVDELRHTYGDVATLNREWGLVYWSHRLSTWADLWTPDNNAQPQYDLAWRRFQARLTTEMITWQAEAVRELARPGQFVTTCLSYERPALDDVAVAEALDVTSGNPYYAMQDSLAHPGRDEGTQGWTTCGTWAMFQVADRMYSSRGEHFFVTETDAQAIGGPATNYPAYPGQWRQAAWALVARGARMVEYWHWHTLHYGTETYWGGVLPHSGVPGRAYDELAVLGRELREVGPQLAAATPDSDVAVLWDTDSRWGLAFQPSLQRPDGSGDPETYPRIFNAFYRGAFDAGLQVAVVRSGRLLAEAPGAVARTHPVLVVPALYVAPDDLLRWLERYAEAGGHLVLGPRTAYADHEARARAQVQPATLASAAGAWYGEFTNLDAPVAVRATAGGSLELEHGAAATAWVDALQADEVEGAEVLAGYDDPFCGAWAAVTTRPHGSGRVSVVGTVPDRALARSLARWLVPEPGAGWAGLPASVTVHTSTADDGTRFHVVHNWSWDEVSVAVPADVTVLAGVQSDGTGPGGSPLSSGQGLLLGPWAVLVVTTAPSEVGS